MIKKLLLSGTVLTVLSVFFFGRDAASYVGTTLGWVKDSVKNSVPLDFEIDPGDPLSPHLDDG